jgi:hypothetical protein
MMEEGASVAGILRFLTDPQATGLGLKACAELVYQAGILAEPIGSEVLERMEVAGAFESRTANGHALYAAMVATGEIRLKPGARTSRRILISTKIGG